MTPTSLTAAGNATVARRTLGTGADALAAARERLAAFQADAVEGVAVPASVELTASGEVVAISARVDGLDLEATVRAMRPLTIRECVWLGQSLLRSLAALHDAGVAHGDVSPRNVVIARRGPVLVDVLGGPLERGTAGFAAPERAATLRPACDVYSVGKVLAAVVAPADATRLVAWVGPMVAADPEARPDARTAARALESCATPQALRAPDLDVAGEMRARVIAPAEAKTDKDPAARGWRVRRGIARVLARTGVAAVAIAVAVGADAAPEPSPSIAPLAERVGLAARGIVAEKYAAMDASDSDRLLAITLEGSQAREAVAGEARRLERGKVAYDGIGAEATAVTVLEVDESTARVLVAYEMSEHTRWRGGDAKRRAATEVIAEWLLVAVDGVWLLAEVTPRP